VYRHVSLKFNCTRKQTSIRTPVGVPGIMSLVEVGGGGVNEPTSPWVFPWRGIEQMLYRVKALGVEGWSLGHFCGVSRRFPGGLDGEAQTVAGRSEAARPVCKSSVCRCMQSWRRHIEDIGPLLRWGVAPSPLESSGTLQP